MRLSPGPPDLSMDLGAHPWVPSGGVLGPGAVARLVAAGTASLGEGGQGSDESHTTAMRQYGRRGPQSDMVRFKREDNQCAPGSRVAFSLPLYPGRPWMDASLHKKHEALHRDHEALHRDHEALHRDHEA